MNSNLKPPAPHAPWGWAAAFAAVLIGAGWQLATRHGVRSSLAPLDLALLRYTIPALLLAPVWLRCGLVPRAVPRGRLALMVCGAGLPFGLLAITGAHFAPAAHMGALVPGLAPVLTLLGAWWFAHERAGPVRWVGAVCAMVGVLCVVQPPVAGYSAGVALGDALFVGAAVAWTAYTLAFRGAGLTPWHAAAVISAWSALAVVPLWAASAHTQLLAAPWRDVLMQALAQGLLAGVLGLAVIGYAIKTVGATATSAVGAMVPVVVAVGAALLLHEGLDGLTVLGSGLTTLGVLVISTAPQPGAART